MIVEILEEIMLPAVEDGPDAQGSVLDDALAARCACM